MRDEVVIDSPVNNKTVGEKWKPRVEGHWYEGAAAFAITHLGSGGGKSCLVIGSPLFELMMLEALYWEVTYLDCREPPLKPERFVLGDATKPLFRGGSFDAVSSTCVLCHAGTGRYGDALDLEHGDEAMLSEIGRILKPEGKAVLMFGPVVDMAKPMRRGTEHRFYTVHEAHRMIKLSGLKLDTMKIWNTLAGGWRPATEMPTSSIENCDYLCVAVTH